MFHARCLADAEVARMYPTLIGLLIVFVALAIPSISCGFLHPQHRFDWRSQAAFIARTFMLIPAVAFTLSQQAAVAQHLDAHGITPPPSVRHVVSITARQGGAPVWAFTGAVEDATALDSYEAPSGEGTPITTDPEAPSPDHYATIVRSYFSELRSGRAGVS